MMATLLLAGAVFLAAAVEATEAFTLVLAASTRSLRAALWGASSAFVLLLGAGGAIGVPLVHFVPIQVLRLGIGAATLYVGSQWLRKAVLRASGRKALHDETAIFKETMRKKNVSAFAIAFNGVMVEGIEVLIIVLTLGASSHRLGTAAIAALSAVVVVAVVGALVARQLSEVPENTLKLVVSVLMLSLGAFYFGEGCGLAWPGRDLSVLGLIGTVVVGTWAAVRALKVEQEEVLA